MNPPRTWDSYDSRPIKVWRLVDERTETCSLGCEHQVAILASKRLGPVVGRTETPVHGSAETMLTAVRHDNQGRAYVQHIPVDFHGGSWWVRSDGVRFQSSVARAKRHLTHVARDLAGHLLED